MKQVEYNGKIYKIGQTVWYTKHVTDYGPCPACNGSGVKDFPSYAKTSICEYCSGSGRYIKRAEKKFEAKITSISHSTLLKKNKPPLTYNVIVELLDMWYNVRSLYLTEEEADNGIRNRNN